MRIDPVHGRLAALYFCQKAGLTWLAVLLTSVYLARFGAAGMPYYYASFPVLFVVSQLAVTRFTRRRGAGVLAGLLPGAALVAAAVAWLDAGWRAWVIFPLLVLFRAGEMHASQAFFDLASECLPLREMKLRLPRILAIGTGGAVLAGFSTRIFLRGERLEWPLLAAVAALVAARCLLPHPARGIPAGAGSSGGAAEGGGECNGDAAAGSAPADRGGDVTESGVAGDAGWDAASSATTVGDGADRGGAGGDREGDETGAAACIGEVPAGGGVPADQGATADGAPFSAVARRYVAWVAAISTIGGLSCSLIDFMFSGRIAAEFGDAARLAGFLGAFQACSDLTNLTVQGTVGGRLFERLPLAGILLARPVALLALSVVAWSEPVLAAFVVMQFVMRTATFVFMSPAWALLLEALPEGVRWRSRRLLNNLDAIVTMLVGLALMAWTRAGGGADPGFAVVNAGLLAFTVVGSLLVVRLYPEVIQDTLLGGDRATSGPAPIGTVLGLRYLSRRDRLESLRALLGASEPTTRARAATACALAADDESLDLLLRALAAETHRSNVGHLIRAIRSTGSGRGRAALLDLLDRGGKPDEPARAVEPRLLADLLEAFGRAADPDLEAISARFLDHPHHRVRGAAIVNLLRHGGSPQVLERASTRLTTDLAHPDPPVRANAAVVLGRARRPVFLPALCSLVDDSDETVARQAYRMLAEADDDRVSDFLAGRAVLPGPRAAWATAAWEAGLARERSAVLRLRSALPEAERLQFDVWWQSAGAAVSPRLVRRLLALRDAGVRQRLLAMLADDHRDGVAREPGSSVAVAVAGGSGRGLVETLERCLRQGPDGGRLDQALILAELAAADWSRVPAAAGLVPLAFSPLNERVLQVIAARALDLAGEFALAWRSAAAPPTPLPPASLPGLPPDWTARRTTLMAVLVTHSPDPERWGAMVAQAGGTEPFVASMAQEYLEHQLGYRLGRLLLPLLPATVAVEPLLEALRSAGEADVEALSPAAAGAALAARRAGRGQPPSPNGDAGSRGGAGRTVSPAMDTGADVG